jgi:hypothetical protein
MSVLPVLMMFSSAVLGQMTPGIQPKMAQAGKLSAVTLFDVSRLPATSDVKQAPGYEDGLVFYFAIVRRPTVSGLFNLTELQDFSIAGRKYSELTLERIGRRFEAITIIEDPADFKTKIRPDLASVVPSGANDNDVIMYTVISGARLPVGAEAEVAIDVGWGDESEKFRFLFKIPVKK